MDVLHPVIHRPSDPCSADSADVLPEGTNPQNQYTRSVDIFAFGLCVLELATKQKLDSHNAAIWPELLDTVQDDETRTFIHRCVSEGWSPTLAQSRGMLTAQNLQQYAYMTCGATWGVFCGP